MVDAWQRAVSFVLCGVHACMHVFMHMGMCLHNCECGDQRVDAGCLFQSFSLQDLSLNPELTGVVGPAKPLEPPVCLPGAGIAAVHCLHSMVLWLYAPVWCQQGLPSLPRACLRLLSWGSGYFFQVRTGPY